LEAGFVWLALLDVLDLTVELLADVTFEAAALVVLTWAIFTAVAFALTEVLTYAEEFTIAAVLLAALVALAEALVFLALSLVAFVVWLDFATLVSFLTAVLTSVLFDDFSTTACREVLAVLFALAEEFCSNLAIILASGSGVFSRPVCTFKLRLPKRPPLSG